MLCWRALSKGAADQVFRRARPRAINSHQPRCAVFPFGESREHFPATLASFPEWRLCAIAGNHSENRTSPDQ
jgi:hypothetical protein